MVLDPHSGIDPCSSCEARQVSVCNAIPDADLVRLASIASVTEVPAGQSFIDEGEPANSFFGVGHFLGLAVSDTYAFSAEAIVPVRYCRFKRTKLRRLLDDFPLMEKRLLEVAANELVAAQEQMLLLGRKSARERLASFLLLQSRQGLPCGHSRSQFTLPMTRGDIADYLGLTIETVSRTLTRLRGEQLIDVVTQNEVQILDHERLESLAGGLN
jgi:CRP/FNR family transcriptional regulator